MEGHLTWEWEDTGKAQHLFPHPPLKVGRAVYFTSEISVNIWTCVEPRTLRLMLLVVEKGVGESWWVGERRCG